MPSLSIILCLHRNILAIYVKQIDDVLTGPDEHLGTIVTLSKNINGS